MKIIKSTLLKRIRMWNLIAIVIMSINTFFSLAELPESLAPTSEMYDYMGVGRAEMLHYLNGAWAKSIAIMGVLVSMVLLGTYIYASRKLKKHELPPISPYFVSLIWTFFYIMNSLINIPSTSNNEGTKAVILFFSLISVSFIILMKLPEILIIKNIFQIESTVSEE